MPYTLEVQKYILLEEPDCKGSTMPDITGLFEHVGYMDAMFKTKRAACEYYNKNNPHMRCLN